MGTFCGGWVIHILGSRELGWVSRLRKCHVKKDDNEFKEKKDNLGQDKVSALQAWSLNFGTPIPM